MLDDPQGNQFSVVIWRPQAEWQDATPQVTPQVTREVARLLGVLRDEMTRAQVQAVLGLKDRKHVHNAYLRPALEAGLIVMTLPDKPLSRLQRYRLTAQGEAWLASRLP